MNNEKYIREDERTPEDLRDIRMEIDVLSNANGSAYIECGGNKIIVGVYGPREIHQKKYSKNYGAVLRCKYNMAPFSVKQRKKSGYDRRAAEISKLITEALKPCILLEKYPRSSIDISIEVLEASGGTRCLGIVGASLALADAEIPMKDLISACAVGKIDDHIILDPSEYEDNNGQADLPIAMMQRSKNITLLQMDGKLTHEEFIRGMNLGMKGCKIINDMQRELLIKKYNGGIE
ncbi:MAG: exosome complex exonuclease Rrp41 [Methanobacteriaceae archaeon]|nr:exosome complex exonuclease Rrp41 [Methanobacteriaceae archaeon]